MIVYKIIFILALLFSACSFKTPGNEWQYKSADAFHSYVKDFMSGEENLARADLRCAIKHAKQSADLTSLARVYLGKCALNISVGIEDKCEEYKSISHLVANEELSNYYGIITKTSRLPAITILDTTKATSILLNGALTKDTLNDEQRVKLLELASYHGYKKAVLFWLEESKKHTNDKTRKAFFQEKIRVLSL